LIKEKMKMKMLIQLGGKDRMLQVIEYVSERCESLLYGCAGKVVSIIAVLFPNEKCQEREC
jgi:hypothetical protein